MRRVLFVGIALVGLGAASACTPIKPPTPEPETVVLEFGFTGAPEEWDVPTGVDEITVAAVGAAGGTGVGAAQEVDPPVSGSGGTGGLGGAAVATIVVTPGETLQINVGGRGSGGDFDDPADTPGGFNGGGFGNDIGALCTNRTAVASSGGGGGASDVRRGAFAVGDRLVVAGGGGGGGSPYAFTRSGIESVTDGGSGGAGGGLDGLGGGGATPGAGGTLTAGGSAGSSGGAPGGPGFGSTGLVGAACNNDDYANARSGGGGGGGLFGGGGGGVQTAPPNDANQPGGGGGGGGSGFPADAEFETGVNAGNGRVVISYEAP